MPKNLSIEDVRALVESKGGTLLTNNYISTGTKMPIRCIDGHEFEMDVDHLRRGQWCGKCAGKLSKNEIYQELVKIAEVRGGRVISKEYRSGKSNMEFECAKGHQFLSRPDHIRHSGSWCNRCSNLLTGDEKAERLLELQRIAESRGGRLLSSEYLGVEKKHHWQCAEGHTWWSQAHSVKNGGCWCRECTGYTPFTIDELNNFAASKGGAFLSKKYLGARESHLWRCAEGHEWFAAPANVMKDKGTWCPVCQSFASERLCRQHFEVLFGTEFKKKRPTWLKIGSRSRLELDGYSVKLGIAFEFHGEQHYRSVLWRKNHKTDIMSQQARDQLKREMCRINGVTLIEVPYSEISDLEGFIREECRKLDIAIPRKEPITEKELQPAYLKHSVILAEFKKLVLENNGKMLPGAAYVNAKTPIRVECGECGHQWAININNLRNKRWCPVCSYRKRGEETRRRASDAKNNVSIDKL